MTITALYTDVVLDEAAMQAARLGLLTELTAERFSGARVRSDRRPYLADLMAARLLELAARWARLASDQERARCAAAYSGDRHQRPDPDLPGVAGSVRVAEVDQ